MKYSAFAIAFSLISLCGCNTAPIWHEDTVAVICDDITTTPCPFCGKQPAFRSRDFWSHTQPSEFHTFFDVSHYCEVTDSTFHPTFWFFEKAEAIAKWTDHCKKVGGAK